MREIKIEQVENGYVLIFEEEDDSFKYCVKSTLDLLHWLKSELAPGSRHDENRIYIVEAPGDKHPNFTDNHGEILFNED